MPSLTEFIRGMPKAELHLHIEGTLEPELKFALAERNGISLPAASAAEMRASYAFDDLTSFLAAYYEGMAVLQTAADFHDLAWAYLQRAHGEGVRYAEIFFDPQAHTSRGVAFGTVIGGLRQALEEAWRRFGLRVQLIMCILRDHSAEYGMATLVQSLPYRDWIVGIGLDSDEKGNPPEKFTKVFRRARVEGYQITMHCDTDQPNSIEHIRQCLEVIGVDRIDHGVNILESEKLTAELKRRGLGLTVCPISNRWCAGEEKTGEIKRLLELGIRVTVNSDDPAYFGGYVTDNLITAQQGRPAGRGPGAAAAQRDRDRLAARRDPGPVPGRDRPVRRGCGSWRAMTPWVLHVDLDQFIAAVEVLRHPELRGRPVVVGGDGDPAKRGVVATASYEAREHGVHSGLPMRTAARRCPDAVFLPADRAAYEAASAEVMTALRQLGYVTEELGWDEAFVAAETGDPEAVAREIQQQIKAATRLESSVGIGENRIQAKLASNFAKPAGVFRLTHQNWRDVMGGQPTGKLLGIGAKTERKLAELGIGTVAELAEADIAAVAARLGPTIGPWLVQTARGLGSAEVSAEPYVPRSRSRETTFQRNIEDWRLVREEVLRLAAQVTRDVEAEQRPAVRIVVKVRHAPFFTSTHGQTLEEPTSDGAVIGRAALAALDRFTDRRPVRLLGVRAEFPPDPEGERQRE